MRRKKPESCDEVVGRIEKVAADLEKSSKRFDEAVEKFNSITPKVERLLHLKDSEDAVGASTEGDS